MEYNSQREHIIIPEYGRNLQKIVEIVVNTEDRTKRTQLAHVVVDIMANIHSQQKDSPELRQRLWDHLHIVSGFRLDVDSPFPVPDREVLTKAPQNLEYPRKNMRFIYYGKNIENIIGEVAEYPDGDDKKELVKNIANHLKKSYLTWNRDSVDDGLIKKHFDELSEGKLELDSNYQFTSTNELLGTKPRKKSTKSFQPRQQHGSNRPPRRQNRPKN
ncbi:MAG TPA: DUF4290 domain-containing protein [Bacteroidales bacterium]|nr:DUF4290 domain-containing protein [Bacteroidales bacterium]